MQLKKLLQGSAFALVAAACAIAVPSVVKAAGVGGDTEISKVTMDGDQLTVVPTNSAKEILVGVAKVKKDAVTVPSWSSYAVEGDVATKGIKVDLSKLSNIKDNYIALTTPGKEVTLVKITAADKKVKAKYVVTSGKGGLQVGSGSLAAFSATNDADKYEYRTAYSSEWATVTDGEFAMYQEEGAKLFVRAVGKGNADTNGITAESKKETSYKYGDQTVKVLDGEVKLPGKELKITIPAKAKGPKVTVDYAKGIIKFPKDSQYRVVKKGATAVPGTPETSPDSIKMNTLLTGTSDTTGNLEVRKKADKKLESKWTIVEIEKEAAFVASATGSDVGAGLITKAVASGVPSNDAAKDNDVEYGEWNKTTDSDSAKAPELKETSSGTSVLSFEYKQPNAKKKEYNLEIKSTSNRTYEIVLATSMPTGDDVKTTKLTSKKPAVLKKVTDSNNIYIRIAGDKKNKKWVSAWGDLGPIDVPKVKAKTGSGS